MKTLNLKSISWSLIAWAMVCMFAFTGCSDDDDEGMKIEFPELKEETHAAGEKITIAFNAPVDWQLTSKASWCKFVNGDFKETTTKGKAGKQTIEAEILDEAQDYTNDNTTEIVLKMGDKEQVIYKITRSKKAFSGLSIKSIPETEGEEAKEYNAENPIVVKGCDVDADRDGYLLINASVEDASLTVGIKEGDYPDWLKLEKVDNGFKLSFNRQNKDKLDPKYSIGKDKGGNIKFSVATTDNTVISEIEIPVEYEGLKEGLITLEPVYPNLSVSLDGQTFTEIPSGMGVGTTEPAVYTELVSTVTTRNDEFKVLVGTAIKKDLLGAVGYVYDFDEVPTWVRVTEEGVKVTVETQPLGEAGERSAIVMVLPKSVYDNVKDDLNGKLLEIDGWGEYSYHVIKDEYANGRMAVLTQEPEKPAGEKITFKGFYLNEKINDWNAVTAAQLVPFEDGSVMETSKQEVMNNFGYEVMAEENVYFASCSLDVLRKGGSICLLVENVPDGLMLSPSWNPWMDKNNEVEIEERNIEGKRYVVLTGVKDNVPAVEEPFSIIVGDFDMGIFAAECVMGFYE